MTVPRFDFAPCRPRARTLALAVGFSVATIFGLPIVLGAQTRIPDAGRPEGSREVPSMIAPLVDRPAVGASRTGSVFVRPPAVVDEPETDWRNANDEAARLGGHAGQVRSRPAQSRP